MSQFQNKVLSNKKKTLQEAFKEVLNSYELIFFFVKRDFVTLYKQTVLGPIWYLLQPIITSFVFLIIFNKFAKLSTYEIPGILFYMIGNIAWVFFATSFNSVSLTLINNADLYRKVYFCRLAPPIAITIVHLIKFFFQFLLFITLYLILIINGYKTKIDFSILYLPLFLIHLTILVFSIGLLVSSITIKYRDLVFALSFGVQMLMFATPVVYSFQSIPEKFKFFAFINPLMPIFENIRNCLFGAPFIDFNYYLTSLLITLIVLVFSVKTFLNYEKSFIDTI